MRIKNFYEMLLREGEGTGGGGGAGEALPGGGGDAGVGGDAAPAPAPASLIGEQQPAETAPFTEWTGETLTTLVPEGFSVTDAQSARLLSIVNEGKGDPSAIVKGMLSYYTELAGETSNELAEQFNTLQTRMQDEVKNDPIYGGPKLEESLRVSREVATRYGGPGFLEMLSTTGAGNSIHMVRFLSEIAKIAPGEGKPVNGTPNAPPKTLEQRLFPKT